MRVLVLSGGVGGDNCHVEVFEDSEIGLKTATQRKGELRGYNPGWDLKLESFFVKRTIDRFREGYNSQKEAHR